jgi:hypothetical protein
VYLASFAGHYKVFALQNLCEKIVSSNITVDTVLDTLRLTYLASMWNSGGVVCVCVCVGFRVYECMCAGGLYVC